MAILQYRVVVGFTMFAVCRQVGRARPAVSSIFQIIDWRIEGKCQPYWRVKAWQARYSNTQKSFSNSNIALRTEGSAFCVNNNSQMTSPNQRQILLSLIPCKLLIASFLVVRYWLSLFLKVFLSEPSGPIVLVILVFSSFCNIKFAPRYKRVTNMGYQVW